MHAMQDQPFKFTMAAVTRCGAS